MAYLVSSDLYIFPPFGSILCYHLIAGDADDFELQTSHFNPENSAEADQTPQGRITIRLLGYFVPPEVDLSIESRIRFLGVFRSCAGDLVFFVFFSLFFLSGLNIFASFRRLQEAPDILILHLKYTPVEFQGVQ